VSAKNPLHTALPPPPCRRLRALSARPLDVTISHPVRQALPPRGRSRGRCPGHDPPLALRQQREAEWVSFRAWPSN